MWYAPSNFSISWCFAINYFYSLYRDFCIQVEVGDWYKFSRNVIELVLSSSSQHSCLFSLTMVFHVLQTLMSKTIKLTNYDSQFTINHLHHFRKSSSSEWLLIICRWSIENIPSIGGLVEDDSWSHLLSGPDFRGYLLIY